MQFESWAILLLEATLVAESALEKRRRRSIAASRSIARRRRSMMIGIIIMRSEEDGIISWCCSWLPWEDDDAFSIMRELERERVCCVTCVRIIYLVRECGSN